jgi:hypothetical protein
MPAILHESDLITGDERVENREQGQPSPGTAKLERGPDALSGGNPRAVAPPGPAPGEYRAVTHGW